MMSDFQDREDFLRKYIDSMLSLDALDFRSEVVVFADLEDESGRNFSQGFSSSFDHVVSEDGKAWAAIFRREFLASILSATWPTAVTTIKGLRQEFGDDPREWVLVISEGGCQLRGTKVSGVNQCHLPASATAATNRSSRTARARSAGALSSES